MFVHFTGEWARQHSGQINDVIQELIKSKVPNANLIEVNVDTSPDLAKRFQIDCVPTILLVAKGLVADKVEGVNIPVLVAKVNEVSLKHFPLTATLDDLSDRSSQVSVDDRLRQLINRSPLMIFMKGNRDAPRCGFSKQLVALLNDCKAVYDTFDILSDEEVRQGLKKFSNWPTYPQVYFKGELIGGLDIIKVRKSFFVKMFVINLTP